MPNTNRCGKTVSVQLCTHPLIRFLFAAVGTPFDVKVEVPVLDVSREGLRSRVKC
jgi:hypothetical protein